MGAGDLFANRFDDRRKIEVTTADGFLHEDQFFLAFFANQHRSSSTLRHMFMRRLDGMLDILRVVIHAAENEQVFEASGDKQLPIAQKAQVARAQEGATTVIEPRLKSLFVQVIAFPVATSNTGAGNPDLTDSVVAQRRVSVRIGDDDLLIEQVAATANQLA